ncbi:hypothetical protein KUH03_26050 [Sphingobacterium sp. E70]|uniref:hypothetical protein n=1 Tax=Sphingobacterium sp. E70 TaxID=2853439 RepID=UPI00211BC679|nr:hypothetical protein [Sphingobacterium sp. E70]ULT22760.1 hypothetical protein KUH03_26050 [Sphingobacterium sp. E70]
MMTKKSLLFLLYLNSVAFAQQNPTITFDAMHSKNITARSENTTGKTIQQSSARKMTLPECEEAFRKNNLSLLAQQYDISQAEADVIQAKIWELPQWKSLSMLMTHKIKRHSMWEDQKMPAYPNCFIWVEKEK